MDYQLTEQQIMIRDLARQVAREKIRPKASEYDEKEEFPWEIMKVLAESDLFGVYIEENPVRASMVSAAEEWIYSSRRFYLGAKDRLVDIYERPRLRGEMDLGDVPNYEKGHCIGSDWFKYRLIKTGRGVPVS